MAEYEIYLDHLNTLTDGTGLIQHAIFSIPNRKTGYTTDDNCRSLIVAAEHYNRFKERTSLHLVSVYLSFLHYAQTSIGKFHNFMSYEQNFIDDEASEDCTARSLMACSFLMRCEYLYPNVKDVAKNIFDQGLKWGLRLGSLRGRAYTIIALNSYLKAYPNDENIKNAMKKQAARVESQYDMYRSNDWKWYEDILTYCNGLMPHAMLIAGNTLNNQGYLDIGIESLDFLTEMVMKDGVFNSIGNLGWYLKGEERAWFDQQPVDTTSYIAATKSAYAITGDSKYIDLANIAFEWFFGKNAIKQPLYDQVTGGCCDGLSSYGVNQNQGAESTVSYLLAAMAMIDEDIILWHP